MRKVYTILTIVFIVLLAVGLRVLGIEWGLPDARHVFSYHPDETITLFSALNINIFQGQLDPGFYNYGSLYLILVCIAVFIGAGWGLINIPAGDIYEHVDKFAQIYMAGRVVTVVLGIVTIYLVYALGRRAYGRGIGILAALFMAVIPIHVMHSKFLAVDVPAAFFVTLAMIFAMRISDGHRLRDYLFAGLFAGLAAGTKYNAGLVVLAPIVAHFATDKARPILRIISPKLLSILIMAGAGFLIGTPGAIINQQQFSHDFLYEVIHAKTGHGLVFAGTSHGLIHHFTSSLWMGMGLPLLVLASIGMLYALKKRTTGDLVLLSFLIAYYAVIGMAQVKFARYTIPLLPVLVILAARVSADLVHRLVSGRAFARAVGYAVILLLVVVTAYTFAYSVALDRVFASADTRDQAAEWMWNHIEPDSSIGLPTIPWFYTPPLDPYFGLTGAEERYGRIEECTDYRLVVSREEEWNTGLLEEEMPDYVILSRFEYGDRLRIKDPTVGECFNFLRHNYRLSHRFAENPSLFGVRIPLLRALPHDMSYASPTILIYTRKD